jgi:hypothetical protein
VRNASVIARTGLPSSPPSPSAAAASVTPAMRIAWPRTARAAASVRIRERGFSGGRRITSGYGGQGTAQLIETALERRARGRDRAHEPLDPAQLGRRAGSVHDGSRVAGGDSRAGVHRGRALRERRVGGDRSGVVLRDRAGLAGERGLDGAQLGGGDESRVRGDCRSRLEHDHVARHQVASVDLGGQPVSHDRRARRLERAQGLDRTPRRELRAEPDGDVQDEHRADRRRVERVAGRAGE